MNRAPSSFIAPSIAVGGLVAAFLLSAGASSAQVEVAATVAVPEPLKARPNETIAIVAAAIGVQIYECKATKDQPTTYQWTFIAPQADLFDARGERIGTHYAGPTWEALDGSRITGIVKARADAPQADAIPWLLLTATPEGPRGAFSPVTSVQRVKTVGGTAPKSSCGASNAGDVVQIPYTADYFLLVGQ
jgi:hypothetical protein